MVRNSTRRTSRPRYLRFAHLAGADLGSTHLEGADLGYAQMQEVSLRSAYVWRALAAGLGDSFAHADVRGINGWPRDQSQLASSILQWLASIPPGSLHDDAQRRFSTLTSVLQLDEERKLFAPWMRAMASIWDEGREDLLLADLLGKLGCTAEFAPYVARGLLSRIHMEVLLNYFSTTPVRSYVPRLAAHLLANDCAGAKGLRADERTLLESLARR